jgi:hypothetical protein
MEDDRRHDEHFSEIERVLREQRHRPTPLDLDRIKVQAKAQAARPPVGARVGALRPARRLVTLFVALGLVVSGGGAAAAMSGKIHVFKHHKTASAAWFQYKPPCPPGKPDKSGKISKRARTAWKHEPCKPPPKPTCSPKGKSSKAHAAGTTKGCPPPCSKSSKAHAAGVSSGCPPPPCGKSSKAHAAGANHSCDGNMQTPAVTPLTPTTEQQVTPPAAPLIGSGPTQQVHTVKKHKAKSKHKAHSKKHTSKKKHRSKKHSTKRR